MRGERGDRRGSRRPAFAQLPVPTSRRRSRCRPCRCRSRSRPCRCRSRCRRSRCPVPVPTVQAPVPVPTSRCPTAPARRRRRRLGGGGGSARAAAPAVLGLAARGLIRLFSGDRRRRLVQRRLRRDPRRGPAVVLVRLPSSAAGGDAGRDVAGRRSTRERRPRLRVSGDARATIAAPALLGPRARRGHRRDCELRETVTERERCLDDLSSRASGGAHRCAPGVGAGAAALARRRRPAARHPVKRVVRLERTGLKRLRALAGRGVRAARDAATAAAADARRDGAA